MVCRWNSQHAEFVRAVKPLAALLIAFSASIFAQEPLHTRIDKSLESVAMGAVTAVVTDEQFARRIYLDLTGTVPSISEVRAFLADTSPSKRANLVDRLLASPQFARHLVNTLDVMLMERRQDKQIKQDEWGKYLRDSVSQNKPWNQLAREILGADGTDDKIRASAKFYLDREGEANLLTRDVGRVFFGMDLGCCQCHDHPLIDSYFQYDYYGIYAFLSRGTVFTDKQKKVFYAEKAEGDVKFTSVFTKKADEIRPRLPGDFEIEEPVFFKGEEYTTAPADGVRPVPKYSRRAKLAELATNGSNRLFNRNIANRLWAMMMGRGLVEPLDMHHASNPPIHPELLELLADDFVKMNFDIRGFLREVALTNAYQRQLRTPENIAAAAQLAGQQLPALESQAPPLSQAFTQTNAAVEKLQTEYNTARAAVTASLAEFSKANDAIGAAQKAVADATKALAESQQQLASKKDVTTAVQEAATKATEAATKLPSEKELAAAAEKFRAKAAQLATELAAIEKLVADRTPPATSAGETLAAAKNAANPLLEKLNTAKQKVAESRQQVAALQEKLRHEQTALQGIESRLSAAKSLVAVGATLGQFDASRKRTADVESQLTTGKQAMVILTAQLPQLETAMNAAKAASDEAAKALTDSQAMLTTKQQAMQLVAETLAKSEIAVQKLPQDADLKQATEALKTRHGQLTTETDQAKTLVIQREQTAKTAADQFAAAQQGVTNARTQIETLQKSLPMLEAQLPEAKTKLAADETAYTTVLRNATENWSKQFVMAPLEPLTPEQMGWSILKVTGVVDQYRAAGDAEVSKTLPIDPKAPADPAKLAERERLIDQYVYDKLKGHMATFVNLFGHAGGQPQRDFFATVDQSLFFANGGLLQSWLNPSGENLLGRLGKLSDPRQLAEELYMSVLIRHATDEEVAAVTKYLEARVNDRPVAIQEMAWALITSAEFRFQ